MRHPVSGAWYGQSNQAVAMQWRVERDVKALNWIDSNAERLIFRLIVADLNSSVIISGWFMLIPCYLRQLSIACWYRQAWVHVTVRHQKGEGGKGVGRGGQAVEGKGISSYRRGNRLDHHRFGWFKLEPNLLRSFGAIAHECLTETRVYRSFFDEDFDSSGDGW